MAEAIIRQCFAFSHVRCIVFYAATYGLKCIKRVRTNERINECIYIWLFTVTHRDSSGNNHDRKTKKAQRAVSNLVFVCDNSHQIINSWTISLTIEREIIGSVVRWWLVYIVQFTKKALPLSLSPSFLSTTNPMKIINGTNFLYAYGHLHTQWVESTSFTFRSSCRRTKLCDSKLMTELQRWRSINRKESVFGMFGPSFRCAFECVGSWTGWFLCVNLSVNFIQLINFDEQNEWCMAPHSWMLNWHSTVVYRRNIFTV